MNNSDIGYIDNDFRESIKYEKDWVIVSANKILFKFYTFEEAISTDMKGDIMTEDYYNSTYKDA